MSKRTNAKLADAVLAEEALQSRERLIDHLFKLLGKYVAALSEDHEEELMELHHGDITCSYCTLLAETRYFMKQEGRTCS